MGNTGKAAQTVQTVAGRATDDEVAAVGDVDAAMARRIVRKIDFRLLPLIFVTCNFFFMDKTILSSAATFNLKEDNHLVGQQYSWVSSIFYFGYLFWMYPTTVLCARLPVARYLTGNTFMWGAVVALTAACSSFGGLMTVRFLLGIAEATIDPAFMFVTSTWYTRDEIPIRTGVWFTGNSCGGIVSNLFAYGVGHIEDNLKPWRYMYIILGSATFCWAFFIWTFLPNSISDATFLTEEERQFARDRIAIAGAGATEKTVFRPDQAIECLVDPKTWLIFAVALCMQIPNGGTQSFGNLVITSFGFTSLNATLIQIPPGVIVAVAIAGTGYIAGRFRNLHCLMIILVMLPPIAGSALIYRRADVSKGVQLFGYMLLSTGPAPMPLVMSLIQANFKGVTKKMTMTAILFVAYCTGSIIGPQLFKSKEAPNYNTAFQGIMICYSLAVVFAITLRCYLQWMNAKRRRDEGIEGSSSTSGAVASGKVVDIGNSANIADVVHDVTLRPEDYDDVTDWKTVGFRYRY